MEYTGHAASRFAFADILYEKKDGIGRVTLNRPATYNAYSSDTLREMTEAIDKYKDYCDASYFGPPKQGTNCYPETLEILVEGQKLAGPDGKKVRFLRRIPVDPMTGQREWGMRSVQDDPDSTSWGGGNLFDVFSKSQGTALDGTKYAEW